MTNRHGSHIWYELLTDDLDGAQAFYGAVMGWTWSRPEGGMERDYRIFSASGVGVGGLMESPDPAMGPVWLGYVGVDDVDASTAKLRSLGGSVHVEPTDIPGIGRFAFVTDPQGAPFYLMRGSSDQESTAFAPSVEGHCGWNELVTSDQQGALDFYGAMFGWKRGDAMPMGEMGDYIFLHHGEPMIGAVMKRFDPQASPLWRFSFRVADIDVARAAVEKGGGTVDHGPTEVPGGDWVIQTHDPQGAVVIFNGSRQG